MTPPARRTPMPSAPTLGPDETLVLTIPQRLWYMAGVGIAFGLVLVAASAGDGVLIGSGITIAILSGAWAATTSSHLTTKRLIHKSLFGSRSLNLDQVAEVQRSGTAVVVKTSGRSGVRMLLVAKPDDVVATISNQLRRATVKVQEGSAVDVLKMRFARGEITKAEYEERLSMVR